jgi:hypothetical protein
LENGREGLLPIPKEVDLSKIIRGVRHHAISLAAVVGVIACPSAVQAHEKWFYDGPPQQTQWRELFHPHCLYCLPAVLLVTGLAAIWWHRRKRDLLPGPEAFGAQAAGRRSFYALVPAILGIHLAVPPSRSWRSGQALLAE